MRRINGVSIFLAALGLGLGLGWGMTAGRDAIREALGAPESRAALSANAWAQAAAPRLNSISASPRRTVVVEIARRVSPAVVSIGVEKTTYQRDPVYRDSLFFPYYQIVPHKKQFPYLGSGVIIDKEGHVLTNYHVIEDAESITVTLTDNRTFQAKLLDADRYVDVALLKMQGVGPGDDLPVASLGDSDTAMTGETVLAIGNPFGPIIADPQPSVSVGVISALNRYFKPDPDKSIYTNMIQTDAAINPGNSGGPLVNLDGEVLGLNTFIFSRAGDSAGVGFSIPVNRCRRIVDEIRKYGKIRSIGLDFDALSLTPYIVKQLGLGVAAGALVRALDLGGAAETAGLQPGDVIVEANGIRISDRDDLIAQFLTRTVGEEVLFGVVRNGEPLNIKYVIKEGGRSQ